jgi:hypothetical protein
VLERDLVAERDWDVRVYDDRARSLTYLCEQPVLLDQRIRVSPAPSRASGVTPCIDR